MNIKSMTLPEMQAALKELGQPAFRAKQIYTWLHKGVRSYDEMTNLSKDLRALLAEKYPSERAVTREIINLTAIRNLPKGTEHFMSDLHGEYEAFCHILNNCSGVIREKLTAGFAQFLYR